MVNQSQRSKIAAPPERRGQPSIRPRFRSRLSMC